MLITPTHRARRAAAAVVAAIGVAAVAAPAQAASVGVSGSTLTFTAGSNEPNVLTVERLAGGYRVTDTGAPLRAVAPCEAAGNYAATCPLGSITLIKATLGNEDDSARVTGATASWLLGGAGTDELVGGSGRDTLDSGTGQNDRLMGGAEVDSLSAERSSGGAWLDGGDGGDTLTGNPSMSDNQGPYGYYGYNGYSGYPTQMLGGAGNDTLVGSTGNDTLDGGAGADNLSGNDGLDAVYYGERTEDLVVNVTDTTAGDGGPSDAASRDGVLRRDLATGIEMVGTGMGDDTITMGATHDQVVAGGGVDTINGGAGHDSLCGDGYVYNSGYWSSGCYGGPYGAGVDTLNGGDGNDQLDGGEGADFLNGGAGRDTASWATRYESVKATIEDVCAGGGLCAAANDGAIDTNPNAAGNQGEGDKVGLDVENLTGGNGGDQLFGTSRVNLLSGNMGNDVLTGNGEDDALCGDSTASSYAEVTANTCPEYSYSGSPLTGGADTLNAGDGDDLLGGGGGADVFNGGLGVDTASYAGRSMPQRATIEDRCNGAVCTLANDGQVDIDPMAAGDQGEGDRLSSDVENLLGGSASDVLGGGAAANLLDGGSGGSDTLSGLAGNDMLLPASGSSCCSSGPDNMNVMNGGEGFDYASYRYIYSYGTGVNVTIDGAANDGPAGAGDNVKTDVEGVVGSQSNDSITGNPTTLANETLLGLGGSDTLDGNAGNDSLTGGTSSDTLIGDAGNDALHSADGGSDTSVNCGAGDFDRVVYDTGLEVPVGCETQSSLTTPAAAAASASSAGAVESLQRTLAAHRRLAKAAGATARAARAVR